ncbi:unnamed protein product [Heligmosomoides polygyrus]|uniref:MADF domain-containing protein n=1 Tax=Heligmosomoides polygyrus TaxID=6339 RepID=A0A183FAJ6_HELPZ|nr:unnamed protein product [Heligmosomoides polygyrus]
MANTYWQRRELKIIKTCANSSCKCDARFNLVDFRQKKEYVYKEMRTTLQPIWVDMAEHFSLQNAVKDDIFPTDLFSLIDDVISAQNAEEIVCRSKQLKSAITIRLLQDRVRSTISALPALMKKIYQKNSDEMSERSIEFGALDVPSGDFTIPPSSYGPGELSKSYMPNFPCVLLVHT